MSLDSQRSNDGVPLAVLLLAPLLVFSPFLFGGYSLSQSDVGVDRSHLYGGLGVMPLADPAGSALLDEPYLIHLKRELLRGRIPILNMKNALGASGVESPVKGSFYILNPLLLLLPTGSAFYYDLFQLIHVYVFLIGTYVLLRKYASAFAAAATAILVGLSGATYLWFNMENYRNFAWLPLMMAGAVGLAREDRVGKHSSLLILSAVACGTAGNPQETAMALGSTMIVYGIEFVSGSRRLTNVAVFAVCLLSAGLVFSPAIFPYVFSLADGNLWATNDPTRSIRHSDVVWIFNWFLPRVTGFYPFLFLRDRLYWPHGDFSTIGCFLLICGMLYGILNWRTLPRTSHVSLCLVIPIVMLIGIVKIVHVPALDFFQYIPIVRELFFIKYHLYLFALASVVIAIGLDQTSALADRARRRIVAVAALVMLGILIAAVLYLRLRPEYSIGAEFPRPVRLTVLVKHIGVSLAVFGIGAWTLYRLPRHWQGLLLGLFVLQAFTALPFGFGKRNEVYPVRFADEAFAGKRLLIRERPNSNLFWDVESITDYDAVVNRHYRDFLLSFFKLTNEQAIYEPITSTLDTAQVKALRLVGTEAAVGFRADAPPDVARPTRWGFEIVDPLPRAFVISAATYLSLNDLHCSRDTIDNILETIQRDLRALPQPAAVRRGNGSIAFHSEAPANAVLVLNYAYSTNWTYRGRKPAVVLGLWPAWRLGPEGNFDVVLTYWPRGLSIGLWSAFSGLMLMIGLCIFLRVRS